MRFHQKLANLVIESDEEEDSLDLELSDEEDSDAEQDPRCVILPKKPKKYQERPSGYSEVLSLSDWSCIAISRIPNLFYLEKVVKRILPKWSFPKLLAAILMDPNPKIFFLRLLFKYWPKSYLSLSELIVKSPRFARFIKNFSFDQKRVSRMLLVTLLDTYLNSLAYVTDIPLKTFDFAIIPKSFEYQTLLRRVLRKHCNMLQDWTKQFSECYIRTYVCMNGPKEFTFWLNFLHRCPYFVRIVGIDLDSPLFTGSNVSMRKIIKYWDKHELSQLHLRGERLFNKEGLYETDVDHLQEIFIQNYRQENPPWMLKLKGFVQLTSLSIYCPANIPDSEMEGKAILLQDRELRRLSPCALRNWAKVLSHLPLLRRLSLRGNYIKDSLEQLLGGVPFCLEHLNLEDCGLSDDDLKFLGRSKHRMSLTELSLGDMDLGEKFGGLLKLVTVIPRLNCLDLCLEGYDRYREQNPINEYQAAELISQICKQHANTIEYINFGGHPWSKPFLLKVIKYMTPLPRLKNMVLPIDGLERESVQDYVRAKLTDASCSHPPLDIAVYGPEFVEIREAVRANMGRYKDPERFQTKALRDGMQILMTESHVGCRCFVDMF